MIQWTRTFFAATMGTIALCHIAHAAEPSYTADGKLIRPADYREWIYLTSGLDMSYGPNAVAAKHSMFDNVFVNPEAYRAFLASGTWPDKAIFVLELRGAEGNVSINKRGQTQTAAVMGFEVHVKDTARFEGGWGFFDFHSPEPATPLPDKAGCRECHEKHGAVDTTFVQFYPTLFDLAQQKGTISPAYLKEASAPTTQTNAPKAPPY